MVITRGSSKSQTKIRRSRISLPKYSSRRKKKFDFAVYNQKLARVTRKTKAAEQSKIPSKILQLRIMIIILLKLET